MSSDDDLLKHELTKLGSISGLGGGLGAQWAAGFLPSETHSQQAELANDPETVLRAVFTVFSSVGRILSDDETESPYPRLSCVVGSGFFRMNPTVVHFELTSISDETCQGTLTGVAKEGLIKQRSAEKAVARLLQAIHDEVE